MLICVKHCRSRNTEETGYKEMAQSRDFIEMNFRHCSDCVFHKIDHIKKIHIFAVVTKAINKHWAGKPHSACGYCFASCQKRACSSLQNKDREGLSLYLLRDHSELKRDRPFDLQPDFILTLCSRLLLTQKHARVRLDPKQVWKHLWSSAYMNVKSKGKAWLSQSEW